MKRRASRSAASEELRPSASGLCSSSLPSAGASAGSVADSSFTPSAAVAASSSRGALWGWGRGRGALGCGPAAWPEGERSSCAGRQWRLDPPSPRPPPCSSNVPDCAAAASVGPPGGRVRDYGPRTTGRGGGEVGQGRESRWVAAAAVLASTLYPTELYYPRSLSTRHSPARAD